MDFELRKPNNCLLLKICNIFNLTFFITVAYLTSYCCCCCCCFCYVLLFSCFFLLLRFMFCFTLKDNPVYFITCLHTNTYTCREIPITYKRTHIRILKTLTYNTIRTGNASTWMHSPWTGTLYERFFFFHPFLYYPFLCVFLSLLPLPLLQLTPEKTNK